MTSINAKFESGTEGFTTSGGLDLFGFQPSGGHKEGYLSYTDLGLLDVNYYQASSEFTGNMTSYLHGTLSYYIKDSGSDLTGEADVQLVGQDGTVLVAKVGQAGADWTKMSIELDSTANWRVGSLTGPAASDTDFRHVLKDVDQILVRADYSTGLDTGGLDSLRLKTAPHSHAIAPQSAFAAGGHAGGAALHIMDVHHAGLDTSHLVIA